ncbi:MAG: hypothetical protein CMB73_05450 [Euryarchaeota archaeon]|nr:hypothetical protein [Euryarchaeota archaeon]|tara:strand:- start:13011 stop:13370 length:360 start_codon:yes stop_codon:yes gene_type:complete
MHGARSILQNALRTCPASKGDDALKKQLEIFLTAFSEIWLAYFKLELVYANLVASRKSILLPDIPHNESTSKENPLNIEEVRLIWYIFPYFHFNLDSGCCGFSGLPKSNQAIQRFAHNC